MAQWTDPSRTYLIQQIRSRQIMWDKEVTNDTSNKIAKHQALVDVAAAMNEAFPSPVKYTPDDIRSQWKNLKDTFVRKLRYINEGKYAYDSQKEPTWKFYRMLSFLDEKKMTSFSRDDHDHPMFDIAVLQREHDLDLVKHEMSHYENSNQSAASSEEQLMNLFPPLNGNYKDKTPLPADSPTPPSPSVTQFQPGSRSSDKGQPSSSSNQANLSGDDDDEPRRKRPYLRRHQNPQQTPPPDEFDLFGQLIAAQMRRISDVSRLDFFRLQKSMNDSLFECQMEQMERQGGQR